VQRPSPYPAFGERAYTLASGFWPEAAWANGRRITNEDRALQLSKLDSPLHITTLSTLIYLGEAVHLADIPVKLVVGHVQGAGGSSRGAATWRRAAVGAPRNAID
jgi:hypothetical protein